MISLHIRDVNPQTVAALKRMAKAHNRSMQGELREILDKAARRAPPESGRERISLITVRTSKRGTWSREEVYGNSAR